MADKTPLPSHIRELLSSLRSRIRSYIWLEGLILALIWLAVTFWVMMLVDFVVLVRWLGISELSYSARLVTLVAIAAVLAYILFQFILRRTFVRLSNRNMALLLERRFQVFGDSLVTAVEMHEEPDHATEFNDEMLAQTSSEAESHTDEVRIGEVLNWRRLTVMGALCLILLAPIGLLAAFSPDTVNTLAARVYGLQDLTWPRKSRIEVDGIEVQRGQSLARGETGGSTLRFQDQTIKVAKGSKLNLWVRADAKEKEVPEYCTIYYRTMTEDTRGRRNMKKVGGRDSGFQRFSFSDKPLEGILDSVSFDVKGRDFWIRNYRIEVVDNPSLTTIALDYQAPKYTGLTPVEGDEYRRGMPLPRGTRVTIRFESNKPLQQAVLFEPQAQRQHAVIHAEVGNGELPATPVLIRISSDVDEVGRPHVVELDDGFQLLDPATDQTLQVRLQGDTLQYSGDGSSWQDVTSSLDTVITTATGKRYEAMVAAPALKQTTFSYTIDRLDEDTALDVSLYDIDGVISEEPYNLTLAATPDEPPDVRSELRGIGAMITPDAVIPVQGTIIDDYGVTNSRLEVVVNQSEPAKAPFDLQPEGAIATQFDFRLSRQNGQLELKPTDKLVLNVIAEDKCDLDGAPNRGEGAPFEIEVVTPDDLLRSLERRELSLRQNFEKIVGEVQELRDSLARIEEGLRLGDQAKADAGAEPGEEKITPEELARRAQGFRLRLVQGAITTSETAARETLSVAESFDAIREELVNNRVDAADREKRLGEEISEPLKEIANKEFAVLDEYLESLEKQLGTEISKTTAKNALNKSDYILAQMEGVLGKMLELEDFNDLLKIVRDLIQSQEELIRDTEKVQKQDLIDLLK